MERPRKGARPIDVDGSDWWFKVGKRSVEIWDPNGTKHVATVAAITNRTPDLIDRGRYKGTEDGMVKPGHVRDYIRKSF